MLTCDNDKSNMSVYASIKSSSFYNNIPPTAWCKAVIVVFTPKKHAEYNRCVFNAQQLR